MKIEQRLHQCLGVTYHIMQVKPSVAKDNIRRKFHNAIISIHFEDGVYYAKIILYADVVRSRFPLKASTLDEAKKDAIELLKMDIEFTTYCDEKLAIAIQENIRDSKAFLEELHNEA